MIPWQQLHGNHILVYCSVEVLKTLDENLWDSQKQQYTEFNMWGHLCLHRHVHTYLGGVFPLSLDKDCGFEIVVPAGPEGALQEGATLNAGLDPGERKVFWEQNFTACDFILREE